MNKETGDGTIGARADVRAWQERTAIDAMRMLFGNAEFRGGEEYRKLQYRFTCAILLFSVLITAIFQVGVLKGQAEADAPCLTAACCPVN